jgi:hypothetical protein
MKIKRLLFDRNENKTAIEVSGLEMPDWIAALLIVSAFTSMILLGVLYLRQ